MVTASLFLKSFLPDLREIAAEEWELVGSELFAPPRRRRGGGKALRSWWSFLASVGTWECESLSAVCYGLPSGSASGALSVVRLGSGAARWAALCQPLWG